VVAEPRPMLMTVEEYLAFDRAAELKHEYVDGHAYAMAGGTKVHGFLSANAIAILRSAPDEVPCRVYTSDVRVQIADALYLYPDVSAGCDPRDLGPGDILLYPRVVLEVLSDSTEAYDRGDKFALYRGCESLEECVLVSQRQASVEVYRRSIGGWTFHAFGPDDVVELDSLGLRFLVRELYAGVEFQPSP
jgi:Uma2 family endonuclease